MTYNNTAIITGNMGGEAEILEKDGKEFAAFSIATTDSYLDDNEEWQQKETVWHKVLVFNPHVIASVKNLKKGTRIEVTGSIAYRNFPCILEGSTTVQKKEAAIIAGKVALKPLVKKRSTR